MLHRTILDAGAPRASTTTAVRWSRRSPCWACERLAIATPYIAAVTERLVTFLAEHGVETVAARASG